MPEAATKSYCLRLLDLRVAKKEKRSLREQANERSDNALVARICRLAEGFKTHVNEMTHSLYHIAKKREIDEKNIQEILDLIAQLEKSLVTSA
jgi:DNA-binding ferritin-like protein (Dps family)